MYFILFTIATLIGCQKDQDLLPVSTELTKTSVTTESRSRTSDTDETQNTPTSNKELELELDSYSFGKDCDGSFYIHEGFKASTRCDRNNELMEGGLEVSFDHEDIHSATIYYSNWGGEGGAGYIDQFGKGHSVNTEFNASGTIDLPFDPSHEIRSKISYHFDRGMVGMEINRVSKCQKEILDNSIDDDCDGLIDEVDEDQDGWMVYEACETGDCPQQDCDDQEAAIHPGATEISNNGIDEDCDGTDLEEIPCQDEIIGNSLDDDCDGLIDEVDEDQDGWMVYEACETGDCPQQDCDDDNSTIHPAAFEILNNDVDENCDGEIKFSDEYTATWEVSYNGLLDFRTLNGSQGLSSNIEDHLLGDFDGDGKTDFLRVDENGWVFILGEEQQVVSTTSRNQFTADQLLVGDFNGDGIDDVLHADGTTWKVSHNGTTDWITLKSNTATKERMHIGDFNGDGTDDVAVISAQRVKYALGGSSDFIKTEGETFKKHGFLIGDFDGDGKEDVFNGNGTEWRVLYSAKGTWQTLRNHPSTTDELQIGYFLQFGDTKADSKADIFKATGTDWRVWYQGKGVKKVLRNHIETNVVLGDFNGNGNTDLMRVK